MTTTGYTRARSMGPVAEAVWRAGGSVARVFRRAELPVRLVEHPDHVILLRDQLALVECAAREIGDEALAPRLSIEAGFKSLGALGDRVGSAPTLGEAIQRCNVGIGALLQSATHVRLARSGGLATWSYAISDSAVVGRQRNELLAFGYMIDLMRHFLGPAAAPLRAELPGALSARSQIQDMLGCEISQGEKAILIFPARLLDIENRLARSDKVRRLDDVPDPDDLPVGVRHLVRLGLLDRRPTIDWVSRRLGLSTRTLHRRLSSTGDSFEAIRERVLIAEAIDLLDSSDLSVSEIAYELGYADPAHFARAVAKWTGQTPRSLRRGTKKRSQKEG